VRTSLPAGTEVTLPGGGGYGPPWERDPELVLEDVRKGYVSAERARRDYGVAIDIERLAVLEHETRALRAKMGAAETQHNGRRFAYRRNR